MKKIILLLLIPFVFVKSASAQGVTPLEWGLKNFRIEDDRLGEINYYVTEKGIDEKKPLLFLFCGTSGLPTMLVVQSGGQSLQLGTVPPDQLSHFSDQFHVAFMAKAGTPFCDTVEVDEIDPMRNLEEYRPSKEYVQKSGMEWEMQASSLVIEALFDKLLISENKVIVLGISEGGILGTRLAAENDRITHLVSVISCGLNQFYSSIINRRMDAVSGELTHQEAQEEIDKLFAIYKDIYSDPNNTEKWYYGHPYKRWGSFCNDIPLTHLVELDIPILFVNGSADRSNPILQSDYIMLEFIRLGKTNLTYHVMPGVDHSLHEVVVEKGKRKAVSHREEVFNVILDWIAAH